MFRDGLGFPTLCVYQALYTNSHAGCDVLPGFCFVGLGGARRAFENKSRRAEDEAPVSRRRLVEVVDAAKSLFQIPSVRLQGQKSLRRRRSLSVEAGGKKLYLPHTGTICSRATGLFHEPHLLRLEIEIKKSNHFLEWMIK